MVISTATLDGINTDILNIEVTISTEVKIVQLKKVWLFANNLSYLLDKIEYLRTVNPLRPSDAYMRQ